MAAIVAAGGEPVNGGERRVLTGLSQALGDSDLLIANWEVVTRSYVDECDVIVITSDAVFIVEVKDTTLPVVVAENHMMVGRYRRPNAYLTTNAKARRLRSKLVEALPWFDRDGRVQALVVFARRPPHVEVTPTMEGRFVGLDKAVEILKSPFPLIREPGRLRGRQQSVADAILGGGRAAAPSQIRWPGGFVGLERLYEADDESWWLVEHAVTGALHVAGRWNPPAASDKTATDEWAFERIVAFRAAQVIGPHEHLLAPLACDRDDDGTVTLICPNDWLTPVGDDPGAGQEAGVDWRRLLIRDVAEALAAIHRQGWGHGAIDLDHVHRHDRGGFRLRLDTTLRPQAPHGPDLAQLADLVDTIGADDEPDLGAIAVAARSATIDAAGIVERLNDGGEPVVVAGRASVWDDYTMVERLGEADDSRTFLARDPAEQLVVLRLLGEHADDDPDRLHEYVVLRGLDHPGVVRALAAGNAVEGTFVVTEFLDGPTLREVLIRDGALGVDAAVATSLDLLSTLGAIHPDVRAITRLRSSDEVDDEAAEATRVIGIVHADLRPENVRVVEGRPPVLVGFTVAADPDGHGPSTHGSYHPSDLPPGIAVPDLDLFAVGVMLHEMATGFPPFTGLDRSDRVLDVDPRLPEGLRAVVEQACAPRADDRFGTAQQFIAALVAAGFAHIEADIARRDTVALHAAIVDAARRGYFDEAEAMCPTDWLELRRRIARLRELAGPADVLLTIDGIELRVEEVRDAGPGTTQSGAQYQYAIVQPYRAVFPGGMLEFGYFRCTEPAEAWVGGIEAIDVPPAITRLRQGLRIGEQLADDGTTAFLRLRQARIDPKRGGDWSTALKKTLAELDEGAGVDLAETLRRYGASGVGTQGEIVGTTGRSATEICVAYPMDDPGHVPAIAWFLTRVMPLARGLVA